MLRFAVGATLAVLPIALMPDAAWAVDGRLRPADYPASWSAAREVVADAHEVSGGDVLLLPLTSYRAPDWLDGGKVLDPMGRYLTPDYVAADDLVVVRRAGPGGGHAGPRRTRRAGGADPGGARRGTRRARDRVRRARAGRGRPGARGRGRGAARPGRRAGDRSGRCSGALGSGRLGRSC